MSKLCTADEAVSLQFHQEILANSEEVLQMLELPYRVVNVCGGDLGAPGLVAHGQSIGL